MKRLSVLVAVALALVALFGVSALQSEATPTAPVQFEGVVSYPNSNPAIENTVVKVYLGGTLKGETTITRDDGFYQITGNHPDFPTGTYRLFADDGVHAWGEEYCFKNQGIENQVCNVTLDTEY